MHGRGRSQRLFGRRAPPASRLRHEPRDARAQARERAAVRRARHQAAERTAGMSRPHPVSACARPARP
ncbi:hypothetical protein F01_480092 [Burkholderia cenocepacia]|nr:hypothetical protein F01_480092 [Burkholderia cenocepacia]